MSYLIYEYMYKYAVIEGAAKQKKVAIMEMNVP